MRNPSPDHDPNTIRSDERDHDGSTIGNTGVHGQRASPQGRRGHDQGARPRRGLAFYSETLGHALRWRNDAIGQADLRVPDSDTEIVLTTEHGYEPNWLVESADDATLTFVEAGGTVVVEPFDIPVGRVAVVADPFGNVLVLVDLTKGRYATNDAGYVTQVVSDW